MVVVYESWWAAPCRERGRRWRQLHWSCCWRRQKRPSRTWISPCSQGRIASASHRVDGLPPGCPHGRSRNGILRRHRHGHDSWVLVVWSLALPACGRQIPEVKTIPFEKAWCRDQCPRSWNRGSQLVDLAYLVPCHPWLSRWIGVNSRMKHSSCSLALGVPRCNMGVQVCSSWLVSDCEVIPSPYFSFVLEIIMFA